MELPEGRSEDVAVHDEDAYPGPRFHLDRPARRHRYGLGKTEIALIILV